MKTSILSFLTFLLLSGENHFSGEVTVTLSGVSISQQVLVGKNRYSGPQVSGC